jgi:carboxyl-terminal processing protease
MIPSIKTFTRIGWITLAAIVCQSTVRAEFEQTKEMAAQTRWVVNTINARHYLRGSMEKLNGSEMVEAYTESFDYGRMYFLRSEVDDFIFRFGDAMEDFLEKGNLYAAFEIYTAYQKNVQARTEWVYARLAQDFDFSAEESFTPDRREVDWPADTATNEDLWERRLKYELLNELLSLAGEEKEETLPLEPSNPDIVEAKEDDSFDPSKIQRLLEDSDFMAETLDAAREKIRRRYERNLTYIVDREAAEVQESFINAMTQLFDPHSSFLSADTLESFNSAVQNSFVGIGALLQDDDGICTIKQILPGGPAEESGLLHDEDKILAVAQGKDGEFEDVVDMQLRYIVRKIKGEKGTIVRLLIRPGSAGDPSARKEVSITRGEVKLTANLASAKLVDIPGADGNTIPVGVIELPSFYGNIGAGGTLTTTAGDVTELLNKLREAGAEGIILDLRMNGGGLLSEAVRVAGLFIPVGPVVQVRNTDGRVDVLSDRDLGLQWDGPLIVLTSRFSASASEIVAGALQDHGRALIVGNTSTHGKGTVQEVYHMNARPVFSWFQASNEPQARPVASKITIKQFYLPGGSSTQLKGVPSDIALPSVNEFLPIGESDLPHALDWDRIDEVDWVNDWDKLNISSPEDPALKAALAQNSTLRQQALEEFDFLQDQIEWRRQRYDEKAISLNLEARIDRKIKDQAYIEQLDDTYEALRETNYASEDFILKIAEEQEALSKKNLLEAEKVEAALAADDAESTEEEAIEEEEEEKPAFDIYLREGARIMADWIQLETAEKAAVTTTSVEVPAEAL